MPIPTPLERLRGVHKCHSDRSGVDCSAGRVKGGFMYDDFTRRIAEEGQAMQAAAGEAYREQVKEYQNRFQISKELAEYLIGLERIIRELQHETR
jgi:hypothetical protein